MIGGYSRRMGTDKFSLMNVESSWLEDRSEVLKSIGLEVIISCRKDQMAAIPNTFIVVKDEEALEGKGIYSSLISCLNNRKEDLLFLPVDMNNITSTELLRLKNSHESKPTAYRSLDGYVFPFPIIIPYSFLSHLIEAERNGVRFGKLLSSVPGRVNWITPENETRLKNFNRPEDLLGNAN